MGRILEALNQAESRRNPKPESTLTLHSGPPEPELAADPSEEDIPFIEVGGPRKVIEASPAVLASIPSPDVKVLPPAAARPSPVLSPVGSVVRQSGAAWKSVTFRPLSGSPLRPAADRFTPELVAYHRPDHPISEGYRSLLANVVGQLPAGRPSVVMFTALSEAETTAVLLNLAITAARQEGLRVVVIDAQRRPAVAKLLGLPETPGLREVAAGSITLQQAVQETGLEGLQALTAGKAGGDGAIPLVAGAMPMALRLMREFVPLVFVDAPSLDAMSEVAAMGGCCDAVYSVVPQAQSESPEVVNSLNALRQQGCPLRGCILTRGD
jgi:Mrp family chromosome partitioning ATPase